MTSIDMMMTKEMLFHEMLTSLIKSATADVVVDYINYYDNDHFKLN